MNLPNKLTLLRIALVPVYLLLMWLGQGAFAANVAALAVFACASLTDLQAQLMQRRRRLNGGSCRGSSGRSMALAISSFSR